jgi:hypothetical protein
VSDFVYLALTLLSFAGLALLIGLLDARLKADPHADSEEQEAPAGPRQVVRR